ncbi:GATS-like protein 1 [Planoprotostelium fungivorum]|uniref:GATS-like protein 1 n=1 Tax=Planoprotostelium fungivorum TaxID=1890364 RepID=A0A2P6NGB4_9EUKA|nr:GATS-like protein 1 [Planoprotostelium fungivorum]
MRLICHRGTNFLSYTETDEEVSIIVDEDSLARLQQVLRDEAKVAPKCWSALRVYEGASAINIVGLVSHLSAPLYRENLDSVYLSTFLTDLIMVPEEERDVAVKLLEGICKKGEEKMTIHDISSLPPPPMDTKSVNKTVTINTLPHRLVIAYFDATPQNVETITHSLLRQFFFPPSQERIFSFTSSLGEITLLVNADSLHTFPSGLLSTNRATWKAIQVQDSGTAFSGANVHVFSRILAGAGVSIYYLSTANSDYILVPEESIDDALTALRSRLNIVT